MVFSFGVDNILFILLEGGVSSTKRGTFNQYRGKRSLAYKWAHSFSYTESLIFIDVEFDSIKLGFLSVACSISAISIFKYQWSTNRM